MRVSETRAFEIARPFTSLEVGRRRTRIDVCFKSLQTWPAAFPALIFLQITNATNFFCTSPDHQKTPAYALKRPSPPLYADRPPSLLSLQHASTRKKAAPREGFSLEGLSVVPATMTKPRKDVRFQHRNSNGTGTKPRTISGSSSSSAENALSEEHGAPMKNGSISKEQVCSFCWSNL